MLELGILFLVIFYLALLKIISEVYIEQKHSIVYDTQKYYIVPKNRILRFLYNKDTIIALLISGLLHNKIKWILVDQNNNVIDEGSYQYLFSKEYKLIENDILSNIEEDNKNV